MHRFELKAAEPETSTALTSASRSPLARPLSMVLPFAMETRATGSLPSPPTSLQSGGTSVSSIGPVASSSGAELIGGSSSSVVEPSSAQPVAENPTSHPTTTRVGGSSVRLAAAARARAFANAARAAGVHRSVHSSCSSGDGEAEECSPHTGAALR